MVRTMNAEAQRLADQLERSLRGGAWHGPGTLEVLTGIDAATAIRRSQGSPHAIVDLVRHIAFWVDAAHVRIFGSGDVDPTDDWQRDDLLSDDEWHRVLEQLEQAHARLHASLLDLDDERLDLPVAGADPTVRGLLLGVLQHNAYHTGQIVEAARRLRP